MVAVTDADSPGDAVVRVAVPVVENAAEVSVAAAVGIHAVKSASLIGANHAIERRSLLACADWTLAMAIKLSSHLT